VLDRDKQLGVVRELTDIVEAAAGDPTQADRTRVLIVESPEGGWGINGFASTGADIVAAARKDSAACKGALLGAFAVFEAHGLAELEHVLPQLVVVRT
jgi:phenylpyruvate tautomerase PptA (4-oxalocrotonate tautomerase family)